ncbi:MAG: TIGR00282 family metallophosphoesterase [Phycisphaeraceae bacterium]
MPLRVIMFGDIVGGPGRRAVAQAIPILREKYRPHIILANSENAASGSGLTPELYRKICASGVDAITLGDHVYKRAEITSVLERESNIIRPANLPSAAKGKRWMRVDPKPVEGESEKLPAIYVLTVLGRIFMSLPANDPFMTTDQILSELPAKDPIVIVEVHAEATSEKQAMGWYFDGRVAAVLGTHTHVATADTRILPGGTAYQTDLGMSGPMTSVLGRKVEAVVTHMTTAMHAPFEVAEGDPRACGIYMEIDPATRRAIAVERIEVKGDVSKPPFVM